LDDQRTTEESPPLGTNHLEAAACGQNQRDGLPAASKVVDRNQPVVTMEQCELNMDMDQFRSSRDAGSSQKTRIKFSVGGTATINQVTDYYGNAITTEFPDELYQDNE
jgi:hypothetical protein